MVWGDRPPIDLVYRARIASVVLAIALLVLVVRLWQLQVVRGEEYRAQSENNRMRTIPVPPPRGTIVDRQGRELVRNRPAFNVELVLEDAPDPERSVRVLADVVGVAPETLLARLGESRKRRKFEPRLLMRDVSRELVAKISARRHRMPGVVINVVPTREYLHGREGAHVLGYIREITTSQLQQPRFDGYRAGDVVGQFGIEQLLERELQGRRGMQYVIVNANGRRLSEAAFQAAEPGATVEVSLDVAVQRAAEMAMGEQRGAIVALDPRNGEVLALVSSPRFDPNEFTGEVTPTAWQELVSGKERRLLNRATQGAYHPGSIFKMFVGLAGLEEGLVRESSQVVCPGFLPFGGRNFRCHKREGHGAMNLYDALVLSCDVYFYRLGDRLGIDRIHAWSRKFGFGERTGLGLGAEEPGLIPSTEWKRRTFRRDPVWHPGETLSVVIGQGATTSTPLQVARGVAALVNGGKVLRPHIVRRVVSPGAVDVPVIEPEIVGSIDVRPEFSDLIRRSMEGVVHDSRGTGRRSRLERHPTIRVGGKTGTAQVVALERGEERDEFRDHAWFVGYAPAEAPEIVVVALIENGGSGGAVAAPVARQVLDAFFDGTRGVPLEVNQGKQTV